MIDIHCHVLPEVDDGADSVRTALYMLEQAYESGTHCIVMTPHCNVPGLFRNFNDGEKIRRRMDAFEEIVKDEGIPIQLIHGMEVYGNADTRDHLRDGRYITLNNTKNLLIEFPFHGEAEFVTDILEDVLMEGYIPVIAHPERYSYVQENPGLLDQWIRMGCVTQVNKGSILGRFGKRVEACSWYLLERGMVAAVASDAHHYRMRTTVMDEVAHVLEDAYDLEYAKHLLHSNPARILQGEDVLWPIS